MLVIVEMFIHLLMFVTCDFVDCRDDDNAGGHVMGAMHNPDGAFNVDLLVDKKGYVVFHCMESARRGPRCARRLHERLCLLANEDPDVNTPNSRAARGGPTIRVLTGGFDQWCRKFWQDSELVEVCRTACLDRTLSFLCPAF